MTFSHCTRHLSIILLIALIARHAHAVQQGQPGAPQAAGAIAVKPALPASEAPAAGVRSSRASPGAVLPSSSLLGVMTNALTEPVLVVPGKSMDPQAIDQAVEDLSIMSRIIEKNVAGDDHTAGLVGSIASGPGLWIATTGQRGAGPGLFFPAIGRPKPMYLGGYGALFFIQVDYPLLPPPETTREQPANSQEDSVWADARRSVLEGEPQPGAVQEEGEAPEPYSREQVEALRTALTTMMKHATNVRALEPAEWVTIVVQGPAPAGPGTTTLTLRASKANVDQYAKGQLSQQQFEQRLQVATY